MGTPARRPLLLLDVDGVLLPVLDNDQPGGYFQPSAAFREVTPPHWEPGGLLSIWISDANRDRLQALSRRFDVVWATGWRHHANEIIAPLHGLPELPVIDLTWSESFRGRTTSWKLPVIIDYVGDRACVWVDDHVRDDARDWARTRSSPTLVLHADHRMGLTDELVEQALAFAAQVS